MTTVLTKSVPYTVFSLNFRSAGKGPFMAAKVKIMRQRHNFLGGRGVMDWGTWACSCWEIWELSSLKHHSLILRPTLCKSAVVIFRQQFKTFNSNNFTLSSMFSFQNAWPEKEKLVSLSAFPYIHSFPCEHQIRSKLAYFLKLRI